MKWEGEGFGAKNQAAEGMLPNLGMDQDQWVCKDVTGGRIWEQFTRLAV